MKVLVLNGSPKGEQSVTLQFVEYLSIHAERRGHSFETLHVAQQFRRLERNADGFAAVMNQIDGADLVLWAFPLYFMLVSSGYKRFIELLFERGGREHLAGRYAASLSTSIHFYDHTAHNYIRAVSEDLGMRFLDSHPAGMQDLFDPAKRAALCDWFDDLVDRAARREEPTRAFAPVTGTRHADHADHADHASPSEGREPGPAATVIVTDSTDGAVGAMLGRFTQRIGNAVIIDLSAIKMGPCLGCLECGFDNRCVYEGSGDEFVDLFRSRILPADAVVFAGTMRDRYLSSLWQRYLERTFVTNHQPRLEDKQVAFIVSGPLSENANAREILQSYVEVMRGNLVDIVTDEAAPEDRGPADAADSDPVNARIDALAQRLKRAVATRSRRPLSFRGVAGHKVFRDEIFGGLRFVFQGDHSYYRRFGLYDFPQRRRGALVKARLMTLLSRMPGLREQIRKGLKSGMLAPYKKAVARARSHEVAHGREEWNEKTAS